MRGARPPAPSALPGLRVGPAPLVGPPSSPALPCTVAAHTTVGTPRGTGTLTPQTRPPRHHTGA